MKLNHNKISGIKLVHLLYLRTISFVWWGWSGYNN